MISTNVLPLHAQRWQRVYTGGTYAVGSSQPTSDVTTGTDQGDANGSQGGGYGNSIGPGLSGKVKFEGQITATFTWVIAYGYGPPPPPPSEVIVEETASASWSCMVPAMMSTGSCENGISSPSVSNTDPNYVGSSSSGVRYVKKTVSSYSFTVTCEPKANADATALSNAPSGYQAGISYQAKVVPFGIALNGVTRVGSGDQLVVGQGCIPEVIYGSTITSVTGVVWSFAGGKPFKSYVVAGSTGTLNPIDGANKNGTKPINATHFAKDESVTISCTGTVNFSNGMPQSISPSVKVSVVAPKYQYEGKLGFVELLYDTNGNPFIQASGPGIQYNCYVPPPTGFGKGEYAVMQLLNIRIEYQTPTQTVVRTTGGTEQLDGSYPYHGLGWKPDTDPPAVLTEYSRDYPSAGLASCIRVSITDHFKTYLMYYPTSNSISRQVAPLNLQAWDFIATATRPDLASPWPLPSPATLVQIKSVPCYDHPVWTEAYGAGIPIITRP